MADQPSPRAPEPGSREWMRLQAEAVERDLAEHGVEYFFGECRCQKCAEDDARSG